MSPLEGVTRGGPPPSDATDQMCREICRANPIFQQKLRRERRNAFFLFWNTAFSCASIGASHWEWRIHAASGLPVNTRVCIDNVHAHPSFSLLTDSRVGRRDYISILVVISCVSLLRWLSSISELDGAAAYADQYNIVNTSSRPARRARSLQWSVEWSAVWSLTGNTSIPLPFL